MILLEKNHLTALGYEPTIIWLASSFQGITILTEITFPLISHFTAIGGQDLAAVTKTHYLCHRRHFPVSYQPTYPIEKLSTASLIAQSYKDPHTLYHVLKATTLFNQGQNFQSSGTQYPSIRSSKP